MSTYQNLVNTSFPVNVKCLYKQALYDVEVISTGCSGFDNLMTNGLWTGEMLEICGLAGSGKTQFCKTACANLICETDKSAFYIDASGSFVSERFFEILAARTESCTPQFLHDALSRFRCLRVLDAENLLVELKKLDKQLTVRRDAFFCQMKLLVLDSISSLVSPILGGGQTRGHMLMVEIGRMLKKMAIEHNLVSVVVNNVVMDLDIESTMSYKPALGKSWKSVPHRRLYIEPVENQTCYYGEYRALMVKDMQQALGESIIFSISAKGVEQRR